MTVTEITVPGSRSTVPGGWTGEGIVDVTLLKGVNLPAQVTFANAKLNECYELADGKLVTKYDPSWSNFLSLEGISGLMTETLTDIFDDFESLTADPTAPLDSVRAQDVLEQLKALETSLLDSPFFSPEELSLLKEKTQCAILSLEEAIIATAADEGNSARNTSGARIASTAGANDKAQQAKTCYIEMVTEFFNAVKRFLARCQNENWAPYDNNGIVPKCLWLNTKSVPYTLDPAFTAGFIDGAYGTVKGIGEQVYTIGQLYECVNVLDPVRTIHKYFVDKTFSEDCKKRFTQLIEPIGVIKDLVVDEKLRDQAWKTLKGSVGEYIDQTVCLDDVCRYNQGKIVFEVVSAFVPVGSILKGGLKAAKMAEVLKAVEAVEDKLKLIHRAIDGIGGKMRTVAGQKALEMLTKGGVKIADYSEGILKPLVNKWTEVTNLPTIKKFIGVKYRNKDGNIVTGDLELVDAGGGCPGGRVASGATGGCDLLFRISTQSKITKFFLKPIDWWRFLDDPANNALNSKWRSYLTPNRKVELDMLENKTELDAIKTEFTKRVVCYDEWGFPDFLSFTKTFKNIGLTCIVPVDIQGKNSDFTQANRMLAEKLNNAGMGPYSLTEKFDRKQNIFNDGITYTWHHHQDGQHMLLVPTTLNTLNPKKELLRHLGGNALVLENLKLAFPSPVKINCN